MIAYRYIIENQTIETFDINTIPDGIKYETIQVQMVDEVVEVPQEVQLWRLRTILKLLGLETEIVTALNNLDEPMKTAALNIWEYGTTVERGSQTVLLLQTVLQLSEEEVNNIFIQANNIKL